MTSDTVRSFRFRIFWILVFSMGGLGHPAWAQSTADTISGIPVVQDADILKFDKQRVILWGIDAPEKKQVCQANGALWGCYDAAFRQMQLLAGRGEVTCQLRGDPDPFGRRYGVCESGGQDLGGELVKAGLALAYEDQSEDYVAAMADAITAQVGLWQPGMVFEEPWIFRRRETPGGYR